MVDLCVLEAFSCPGVLRTSSSAVNRNPTVNPVAYIVQTIALTVLTVLNVVLNVLICPAHANVT